MWLSTEQGTIAVRAHHVRDERRVELVGQHGEHRAALGCRDEAGQRRARSRRPSARNSARTRGSRSSPLWRSCISREEGEVVDARGLRVDAAGATCAASRPRRTTPIGISWHMPTLRTFVPLLIASVTRLIGFERFTRKASGQCFSMFGADAQRVLDASQRVEYRARAAVLTVDLRGAVAPRDLVVLAPVVEAAELGSGDDEVGAVERGGRIGGLLEHHRRPVGGVEPGGEAVGAFEPPAR